MRRKHIHRLSRVDADDALIWRGE